MSVTWSYPYSVLSQTASKLIGSKPALNALSRADTTTKESELIIWEILESFHRSLQLELRQQSVVCSQL